MCFVSQNDFYKTVKRMPLPKLKIFLSKQKTKVIHPEIQLYESRVFVATDLNLQDRYVKLNAFEL